MREVILTVGPRAAGKSHFCEKALEFDPSIVLVSRDRILIELCGASECDPYSGGHFIAEERMWKIVKERMGSSDVKIILDAWNGCSDDRASIRLKLRSLGADQIIAWYFVTPLENVAEWFWKKPGIAKYSEMKAKKGQGLAFYSENAPQRDYKIFHELARNIHSDGFDKVIRLNPIEHMPSDVLVVQPSLQF